MCIRDEQGRSHRRDGHRDGLHDGLHHRQPLHGYGSVVLQRECGRHRDLRRVAELHSLHGGLSPDAAAAARDPRSRGVGADPAWLKPGHRALLEENAAALAPSVAWKDPKGARKRAPFASAPHASDTDERGPTPSEGGVLLWHAALAAGAPALRHTRDASDYRDTRSNPRRRRLPCRSSTAPSWRTNSSISPRPPWELSGPPCPAKTSGPRGPLSSSTARSPPSRRAGSLGRRPL